MKDFSFENKFHSDLNDEQMQPVISSSGRITFSAAWEYYSIFQNHFYCIPVDVYVDLQIRMWLSVNDTGL